MKIDRVKISLINIATSVSFCCIILFGDKLPLPMFLYMIMNIFGADDLPFANLPMVNTAYNYSITAAWIVLLCNGFYHRLRWRVCAIASIWLFGILFTPVFSAERVEGVTLGGIIVFSMLNLLALVGNCLLDRRKEPAR